MMRIHKHTKRRGKVHKVDQDANKKKEALKNFKTIFNKPDQTKKANIQQ